MWYYSRVNFFLSFYQERHNFLPVFVLYCSIKHHESSVLGNRGWWLIDWLDDTLVRSADERGVSPLLACFLLSFAGMCKKRGCVDRCHSSHYKYRTGDDDVTRRKDTTKGLTLTLVFLWMVPAHSGLITIVLRFSCGKATRLLVATFCLS